MKVSKGIESMREHDGYWLEASTFRSDPDGLLALLLASIALVQ